MEEEQFFLIRRKHVVKRVRRKTIIKAFNIFTKSGFLKENIRKGAIIEFFEFEI